VIGKDGEDKDAMKRRLAVREEHLHLGNEMEEKGDRWYGCALLDDDGKMIGSMAILDFPSEKELNEYLGKEPYILGKVWKNVEVCKCNVKNPWEFNRPKEFFEKRGYKKIT